MKTFVRGLVFVVLTWLFLILISGLQGAAGLVPEEFGLAQLAPGIAAFLMLAIFRRDGRQINFVAGGLSPLHWILAVIVPLGVGLLVFVIARLTALAPADEPGFGSVLPALIWMPFGALGEEIGWRGYLQPMLAKTIPGPWSAIIVGLLWVPIHMYFFSNGVMFMSLFFLLIIAYSLVIFSLTSKAGFPVLAAMVFHLCINISSLVSVDYLNTIGFMAMLVCAWVLAAAVSLVLTRSGRR